MYLYHYIIVGTIILWYFRTTIIIVTLVAVLFIRSLLIIYMSVYMFTVLLHNSKLQLQRITQKV